MKCYKPDSGATAIKTINGYAGDVVVKKNQIAQTHGAIKMLLTGAGPFWEIGQVDKTLGEAE